ncbi:MAG TPA: cobalt-precorrin-6A reductase [Azospirillum sp.]|nr:cobalt-precorrin-6A reductase [Azospirillum sp.]
MRVLILGGTTEAAALARALVAGGFDVITSLAGRTRQPAALPGSIRTGGFGGAQRLADYLASEDIDVLIDATHPFAAQISANAAESVRIRPTPRLMLVRPGWTPQPGDRWTLVPSIPAAAEAVPAGARAFLAIGRQELAPFAGRADAWFLIRSVEPPDGPLPPHHEVVTARGPFRIEDEVALLKERRIELLVAKNSGGDDAKLVAARRLGVPVVLVERPVLPPGERVGTVTEAMAWLAERRAEHGGA